ILIRQRLHRVSTPHLSIYSWQITWVFSISTRIKGLIMSGGLYTFDAAHVVSPYFGCYMSAEALAASFSTWPVALKFAVKALVAWSFTFDGSNGSRHLSRDAAMITTSQVMRTGWEVVALSLTAAL
ncbi:uncharacterized protein K489DRAFT_298917, partial [Dissoconium aciculare CBS 342.82]|uniref:Uncharacterized protein n=1 Tax=Dissoconium aciculare CBS 342.82 TaxID=1314786 RepID=A0A6J3LTK7_9PEZI